MFVCRVNLRFFQYFNNTGLLRFLGETKMLHVSLSFWEEIGVSFFQYWSKKPVIKASLDPIQAVECYLRSRQTNNQGILFKLLFWQIFKWSPKYHFGAVLIS